MHLCTLPKWAALIVTVLLWPFASAVMIYLLLTDGDYNLKSILAGIFICIFFMQVKMVWRIFVNG